MSFNFITVSGVKIAQPEGSKDKDTSAAHLQSYTYRVSAGEPAWGVEDAARQAKSLLRDPDITIVNFDGNR